MGKVRYSLAIILPVILAVAGGILMHDDIEKSLVWYGILGGFAMGMLVGEFIFGEESLATRVFIWFLKAVAKVFLFWFSFFIDGKITIFILGIILTTPLFSVMGFLLSAGWAIFVVLGLVLYIPHLIIFGRDLY